LLTYLSEVLVNGNPEVKGRKVPDSLQRPPVPPHQPGAPPDGTRQLLDELGPEKFAEWTRAQRRLLLTDTTMRDAHQSLLTTRVRTYDLVTIANFVAHELPGLYSLEMWGGATFDVAMRFLLEDPWKRLRRLRELIPNICFQMLFRASNAVGYTAYPDSVVREFVREAAAQGIDIFRIFDSLNWMPNMKVAIEATLRTGRICEPAICYTGDILDPKRDKYPLKYYVGMAKELERMGAHMLGIKDMAGLCKPYAAEKLVRALKDELGIPVHFHTHDTSGINAASVLKASDAGVDVADGAVASMSGTTSQPNLNSIVAALAHTRRDSGLNLDALNRYADYWEAVRMYYAPFDNSPKSGSAEVYVHEIPGGQYTNFREQAESMGLGDRWHEITRTYADVNRAFGDIVKVTPSSKVVGDMALFLVSHGMTMHEFESLGEDHHLTVPNSVVEMFSGALGQPAGGWPKKLQKIILRGARPQRGRPGASLPAIDFSKTAESLETKIGRRPAKDEVLSYVLYPDVFTRFASAQHAYGDVEVLPTAQFFYEMPAGEEIAVELEPGKTIVVKFQTLGELRPDGYRTVFFELNGQPREVVIRDKSYTATRAPKPLADPNNPGHIGAPTPGLISVVWVELNQAVQKGDRLLVLEAMKMQSTVYAPVSGKVAQKLVATGENVEAKQLLLVIE
jgi:pyruvate carboxylase